MVVVWAAFVAWSSATWMYTNFLGLCIMAFATAILFQRERGPEAALRAIRDWFGLALFLLLYAESRSIADTLGMPVQESVMIAIDRVIGFGELPTHRLQSLIDWDAAPRWWEVFYALNYGTHFMVSISVLGTLYVKNRPRWSRFMRRWVLLSLLGLVGYVLLPTVPPWMSSDLGNITTVHPGLPRSWSVMHIPVIEDLFSFGRDHLNPIAAMPSLHAAYPALLFLFFAPSRKRFGQFALAAYTLFMAWTIVITGQHWVIDIFAGWAVAWFAHRIVGWTETRFPTKVSAAHT